MDKEFTSAHRYEGSCLCGAVTIGIDRFQGDVTYCHCTQCRKQTGLYYAAVDVLDSDLHYSDEAVMWYAASSSAKRGFCPTCGSALFWRQNGKDRTAVMPGCINGETGLKADGHIFVSDRGDYYCIADGLPTYPQSD